MQAIEYKLQVLSKIGKMLNEANITWAVGASLLLYFKDIVENFNDIDIMVIEEDVFKLKEILLSIGIMSPSDFNEKYRTKYFMEFEIEEVEVDVMAGFTIRDGKEEYDCSLQTNQIVEHVMVNGVKIPLQAVTLWRRYYQLMHRENKVVMIDNARR